MAVSNFESKRFVLPNVVANDWLEKVENFVQEILCLLGFENGSIDRWEKFVINPILLQCWPVTPESSEESGVVHLGWRRFRITVLFINSSSSRFPLGLSSTRSSIRDFYSRTFFTGILPLLKSKSLCEV
jgi:hypothetical protein